MTKKIIFLCLFIVANFSAHAQADKEALKKFMNDRFGMFIHWGPVSLRGTEIGWSRDNQVAVNDYDNLYKEFNPVLFNAEDIVKVAKDAGMKYLTITARHHDGFCLWPSAFTDYNIANTPYKKDIVAALNEACKKAGIKFCIYYSVLDWYHPDYPKHSSKEVPLDPKSDMQKYIAYMKNQLKELITNYDPYMLWFDGQWEKPWTDEMGKDIYDYVKKLKPSIITNNRLGKEMAGVDNKTIDHSKIVGDYDTPEQVVGKMNMDIPWESCFTICKQWSWKPNDKMKSLDTCISILAKTAGGNGNLLLNVGPMPDGRIEARQIKRLEEIGNWLKTNGQAIYGTLGGPYEPKSTYATTRKDNKVYIHLLDTNASTLDLKQLPGRKINKAYVLGGDPISITSHQENFTLSLPTKQHARAPYVIVLELNGSSEHLPIIK